MKKKKGSEEENKNRFHKEYGLWSNMRYVAKSMFRTEPKLRIIIAVLVISVTATRYLWTFISKFVLDAVTGRQSIKYLIVLMLALVAAQLVFTLAETWAQYDNWYRYI
ncbi:MAG: hypothetical protein J6Z46_07735, partial [Lachnospiraceae bacterium]|nr:hypothetical protein [Lachnospiraceae bacterium]